MSAEDGGRLSLDHYERYGPYGNVGSDVGERAIGVLAGLLESVPDSMRSKEGLIVWSANDSDVFEDLMMLEVDIKFIEPGPDVDGGEIGDLHRSLARFHTALPLSEAERHWLFDPIDKNSRERPRVADIHEPETILGAREEIISGGVRRVIRGLEIIRRLGAWRRETAEFAGQGSLNEARQALGVLAETLVIEPNWPRTYPGIRAKLEYLRSGSADSRFTGED